MSKEITLDETKDRVREIVCKHCDTETNHLVCNSLKIKWSEQDGDIQGIDIHEIIKCSGCDDVSFIVTSSNSDDYYHEDSGETIYNQYVKIYPNRLIGRTISKDRYSLPEKVRLAYTETHTALCTELKILTAIGIRTLVEAICLEEKAEGNNLEKKINDLVKKDLLTKRDAEILHKTRIMGNNAVHEIKLVTDTELDIAFDIMEHLLETVYIIPKKAERLMASKMNNN